MASPQPEPATSGRELKKKKKTERLDKPSLLTSWQCKTPAISIRQLILRFFGERLIGLAAIESAAALALEAPGWQLIIVSARCAESNHGSQLHLRATTRLLMRLSSVYPFIVRWWIGTSVKLLSSLYVIYLQSIQLWSLSSSERLQKRSHWLSAVCRPIKFNAVAPLQLSDTKQCIGLTGYRTIRDNQTIRLTDKRTRVKAGIRLRLRNFL